MRDITGRCRFVLVVSAAVASAIFVALALLPRHQHVSANPLFNAATVAAGSNHTCVLTSSSGVLCWGENHYGQLGDGTSVDRAKPVPVSGLSSGVHSIAAGDNHTCALLDTGAVKCWGYNRYGQLGNAQNLRSSIAPNPLPLDVIDLDSGVIGITAGAAHTCALINTGGVKCWGWDRRGQLGDGPGCPDYTCTVPRDVSGLTSGVGAIDAGPYHTCAVLTTGGVKCWGQNDFSQLGTTTGSPCVDETLAPIPCAESPVDVPGLTDVLAIGAGGIDTPPLEDAHTCTRILGGAVKCWGSNDSGQLGDGQACGMVCQSSVNVDLGEEAFSITVGGQHTCATLNLGVVKCWGENSHGQLGDGNSPNDSVTPIDVCADVQCGDGVCVPEQPCGVLSGVSMLSLGLNHSCALVSPGGVKCWGDNGHGQLDDSGVCGTSCDTPVDALLPKGPLPDLAITGMRIELETGGSCAFMSTTLGVRVEFRNTGNGAAGPFVVDVDGATQTVDGLAAGASSSLWFSGYSFPGDITATLDATSLVTESDETNNTHTKAPPVPTLPPTCTSTPAFVSTFTPTPTLTPVPGLPDLVINGIQSEVIGFCIPSAQFASKVGFMNIGDVAAGPFSVQLLGQLAAVPGGLAAHASGEVVFNVGPYLGVEATIDPDNLVQEGNESNNSFTVTIPYPTATPMPTCATITPTPQGTAGDANCDHTVNSIDAALVLQHVAGLLPSLACSSGADANHGGRVDSIDAALILQYAAGLLTHL